MARFSCLILSCLLFCSAPLASEEIPASIKRSLAARDFQTAVTWLNDHRDDPDAAFELGKLYRLGNGVEKDQGRAVVLFESAARSGHVEAQYLLGKHHERNGIQADAVVWMEQAAANGHTQAVSWLERQQPEQSLPDPFNSLRRGAAPPKSVAPQVLDRRDASGRTLLMFAAEKGSLAWTNMLIEQGASVDLKSALGSSALHIALSADALEIAAALLEAGADPDLAMNNGTTPLHQAVAASQHRLVARLLKAGADPGRRNNAGWSPRMLARRGDDADLQALLGIDQSESDPRLALAEKLPFEESLKDSVVEGDSDRAAVLLAGNPGSLSADRGAELVRLAVLQGSVDVLGVLLDSDFDSNGADARNRTALLIAADSGCRACVEALIEHHADVNQADGQANTPLILAIRRGHEKVAATLLNARAEVDHRDKLGRTALWWACRKNLDALAIELIERSALVGADLEQVSPLHIVAESDNAALTRRLSGLGGVDDPTSSGNTPLLLAAHAGAQHSMKVLLAQGADTEIRNHTGDTPLIAATRSGHLSAAELLLEAGANPSTRNDRFESAATIIESGADPEWQALLERTDQGLLGLFRTPGR